MATILLAEDDDVLRQILLQALNGAGHTALGASSGAEALVPGRFESLDVVITDLGLPDMSGIDVAEQLREDFPHLPALLISGHDDLEGELPTSPSALLTKPFSPAQLMAAVGALTQDPAPDAAPPGRAESAPHPVGPVAHA